ncbi:hypothetical protein WOC76_09075 [Methylocystis sp. IM3]|uniref:hypothetical protein n=1 Tax=unclassified Methylocystis TaxID=2625913 RepID=UPI0030F6DAF9
MRGVDRLGRTQENITVRLQRIVEKAVQLTLKFALEINEKIATGNEVDLDERWVLERAMRGKQDEIAKLLFYAVERILLHEKTAETFLGDVGLDRFRIAAFAGCGERGVVDVAGEYLHDRMRATPRRFFQQENAQAIGLFSGRATDDPDANRRLAIELVE